MTDRRVSNPYGQTRRSIFGIAALVCSLSACGGSEEQAQTVALASTGPNVVSYWNDIPTVSAAPAALRNT